MVKTERNQERRRMKRRTGKNSETKQNDKIEKGEKEHGKGRKKEGHGERSDTKKRKRENELQQERKRNKTINKMNG